MSASNEFVSKSAVPVPCIGMDLPSAETVPLMSTSAVCWLSVVCVDETTKLAGATPAPGGGGPLPVETMPPMTPPATKTSASEMTASRSRPCEPGGSGLWREVRPPAVPQSNPGPRRAAGAEGGGGGDQVSATGRRRDGGTSE